MEGVDAVGYRTVGPGCPGDHRADRVRCRADRRRLHRHPARRAAHPLESPDRLRTRSGILCADPAPPASEPRRCRADQLRSRSSVSEPPKLLTGCAVQHDDFYIRQVMAVLALLYEPLSGAYLAGCCAAARSRAERLYGSTWAMIASGCPSGSLKNAIHSSMPDSCRWIKCGAPETRSPGRPARHMPPGYPARGNTARTALRARCPTAPG